jgi:hypothetical protein
MENVSTENTPNTKKGVVTFILIVAGFLAAIIALKFLVDMIM